MEFKPCPLMVSKKFLMVYSNLVIINVSNDKLQANKQQKNIPGIVLPAKNSIMLSGHPWQKTLLDH